MSTGLDSRTESVLADTEAQPFLAGGGMRSIGFRAEKEQVAFAVVDCDGNGNCELHADGKLSVAGDETSKALALFRNEVMNVISKYKPVAIGMRTSDNPKQTRFFQAMLSRARVEGVILEAAGFRSIKVHYGASSTIKAGMGTKKRLSTYTSADSIRGIDLSGKKNVIVREAVLAALAALGS